ncbi:hypothetical protein AAFM46_02445 [Arthrobacter sp. TMP15]|uniref:hypothetical protein n=1 Tax=Arthrobacter sp. TMP15 TaxID=3140789 RepID=UPI0031BADD89
MTGSVAWSGEADESFLGGPEQRWPGCGARGKLLLKDAVELEEHGLRRFMLGLLPDVRAESLAAFFESGVEASNLVFNYGRSAYLAAIRDKYARKGTSIAASGKPGHEVMPGIHLLLSLVKG